MKLKHLESALSSMQRDFPNPDVRLEQYPSSPQLAAAVVFTAFERNDVGPGRTVLDLGCGTGMLTAAAAYCESDHVWAIDCDESALMVARVNLQELELDEQVSFLLAQVKSVGKKKAKQPTNKNNKDNNKKGGKSQRGAVAAATNTTLRSSTQDVRNEILNDGGLDGIPLPENLVDTVLTNPPFGTKDNAGMDLRFLKTATRLASRAVYSFHKTSTRAFLKKHVETVWNLPMTVVAEMKFDIPKTYQFHKHQTMDIEVDLIRIDLSPTSDEDGEEDER
mmetsp:Transcript_2654/g.3549  ORF Transcript_2654/g.3549 Transcript_2654/m.3549 type:complete len:278 (-) Transcript_2654:458-1291(-)|eukprot:CAMPEP_0198149474 /NCGR_PEP_ID=MMETSP1443-20131203/46787_1 /TAXON_ID=186043 /ORGANISM="Entomoneis sp., Strain CCMP2396" /LENGTH=277 /DNA_ID=CAMNT_0043814529 /DNA_START=74 /DNA_END=907 /DNA_ORIENTATION=-